MAIKAIFSVKEVFTAIDKPIPFTKEVIKAGTTGEVVCSSYGTYTLKFYDFETFTSLYLDYKIADLSINGTLESLEFTKKESV